MVSPSLRGRRRSAQCGGRSSLASGRRHSSRREGAHAAPSPGRTVHSDAMPDGVCDDGTLSELVDESEAEAAARAGEKETRPGPPVIGPAVLLASAWRPSTSSRSIEGTSVEAEMVWGARCVESRATSVALARMETTTAQKLRRHALRPSARGDGKLDRSTLTSTKYWLHNGCAMPTFDCVYARRKS